MSDRPSSEVQAAYAAWRNGALVAPLAGRAQIELAGADRASFLHQLTTNHIKGLEAGHGCEAFLCNSQGKTIGHGYIYAGAESHVLDSAPGQAETLYKHLDRYLIREQVTLRDRSNEWGECVLAGPRAADTLRQLGCEPPIEDGRHVAAEVAGIAVSLRRWNYLAGDCWLLSLAAEQLPALIDALAGAGATRGDEVAVEIARHESGTPRFGDDLTNENLPQELSRDSSAISFVKGCYLGQETVARIDAHGHVNRLFAGLRFDGEELPARGASLLVDDKPVGQITSACWSLALDRPLAFAYLRRAFAKPGQLIQSPSGTAQVVSLPLAALAAS